MVVWEYPRTVRFMLDFVSRFDMDGPGRTDTFGTVAIHEHNGCLIVRVRNPARPFRDELLSSVLLVQARDDWRFVRGTAHVS